MKVSVIIPVLNEEIMLPKLLHSIIPYGDDETEFIVVDGGSTDQTLSKIEDFPIKLIHSKPGRAVQMNTGAEAASGEVLYFLHSDTIPPITYLNDIRTSITKGYDSGCYQLGFDSDAFFLKINTFFTRFRKMWNRGGDQSLFIKKDLFYQLGRFPNDYIIMEEYVLIEKLVKHHDFRILPKKIIASARKYEKNHYLKVQYANLVVFRMYRKGASQEDMYRTYRTMLKY